MSTRDRSARALLSTLCLVALAALTAAPGAHADERTPGGTTPAAKPATASEKAKSPKPANAKTAIPKAGQVAAKTSKTATTGQAAKDSPKVVRAVRTRGAPRSLAEAQRRLKGVRVDVEWRDESFRRVVRYIGEMSDFNIIVSPRLQAEALDQIGPITLKLKRVTLLQVTELVAKFTSTSLKLDRGILQFTTKADARGKPVLRIYSIATITAEIRNFPGPDMNLRPSGAEFEQEEESVVENSLSDPDRVADMIKEMVETESWEDDDVSIGTNNHKLIVRQYPAVHRKIARFLAMLRAAK